MTQVMYAIHLASRIITASANNFKYWMLCVLSHTEPNGGADPREKQREGPPVATLVDGGPSCFVSAVSVTKMTRKCDPHKNAVLVRILLTSFTEKT